jgi:hypothetical protein
MLLEALNPETAHPFAHPTISRQAYGFRNFENYRQRVQVLCG